MSSLAKTPSESRTIRFSNRAQIWTWATIAVTFAIDLLANPVIASFVTDHFPPGTRIVVGIVISAIIERYRYWRCRTTQPIQKEVP